MHKSSVNRFLCNITKKVASFLSALLTKVMEPSKILATKKLAEKFDLIFEELLQVVNIPL